MSKNRKKVVLTVATALIVPLVGWLALYQFGLVAAPGKPVRPPFNLSDRIATIQIVEDENGELLATFEGWKEGKAPLTADQFFEELKSRNEGQNRMPWLFRKMDVTSTASLLWVAFGFAAQGVFAGRMIVQWYASEKAKASVVPNVFWWMSLIGSSMCIIYFIWRKDPVGITGQATGWFIYVRNLWMIYAPGTKPKSNESE